MNVEGKERVRTFAASAYPRGPVPVQLGAGVLTLIGTNQQSCDLPNAPAHFLPQLTAPVLPPSWGRFFARLFKAPRACCSGIALHLSSCSAAAGRCRAGPCPN